MLAPLSQLNSHTISLLDLTLSLRHEFGLLDRLLLESLPTEFGTTVVVVGEQG